MDTRSRAEIWPTPGRESTGTWRFADFEFDLRRAELRRRSDGAILPLRPKTELLLRRFLAEPGRLLTKQELMDALWPESVVTDDSLVQCIGELRQVLGDVGQLLIRTVLRRGYRLECPVTRVDEPSCAAPAIELPVVHPPTPTARAAPRSKHRFTPVLALLAVLALGLVILLQRQARTPHEPFHIDQVIAARSTVAIMPFDAAGSDAALRRLGDAIADGIAGEFSNRPGMRGIGRATTAAHAASGAAASQVAAALKAQLVVTGHVQPGEPPDEGATVDVQMQRVPGGEIFWAQKYRSVAPQGNAAIELIGRQVVNAVRAGVGKHDVARSEADDASVDPAVLTLRAWTDLDRRTSAEDVQRARRRFTAALRADPDSLIASYGYAIALRHLSSGHPGSDDAAEFEKAVKRLRELAPEEPNTLMLWSSWQLRAGRAELALAAIDKAIRIAPSYANGHVLRAKALLMLGRAGEVQAEAERAVALSQGDPRRASDAYTVAAEAALRLGDNERAHQLASQAVAQHADNQAAQAALRAADAQKGRDAGVRSMN